MKKSLKNQIGWTTMEYVVGALIIIGIVTSVIGVIQTGLKAKAENVVKSL